MLGQSLGESVGLRPVHPLLDAGGDVQPAEDRLFRLRAESFQLLHAVGQAGLAQLVECGNMQLVV